MIRSLVLLFIFALTTGCNKKTNYLYIQPAPLVKAQNALPPGGSLSGTIVDAVTGNSLEGVEVRAHLDPTDAGVSTLSDSQGTYIIGGLTPGRYVVDFVLSGYISILAVPTTLVSNTITILNETMTKNLGAGQFRFVMTWCGPTALGAVKDVDSYLAIPGDEPHPVGFSNKDDHNGANLDRDDTQWSGPETITITQLKPGIYTYYVNNYSSRSDPFALGRSSVQVNVFEGTQLIKTYSVSPGAGTGNTYQVLKIINGVVVDAEMYNDTLPVY